MSKSKFKTPLLFLYCLILCLSAGFIGSIFTTPSIPTWYAGLAKPFFSPPNWLFGPVWTFLYLLMGISLWLVMRRGRVPVYFWFQLILNTLWSIIFFGFRSPFFAFIEILILWYFILRTIKSFTKISSTSAYLLYPYLAWVSFASILNFSIWFLNCC